ncbi:MAG TPA: cyclase family protein [Ktedonobacterales bacterium]|jgi:kynurenine formamidase|nr:cyclase family protein [Ktedonobacterales bacterium]
MYSFQANTLAQLIDDLTNGSLKIVDLTTTLGPDTPVIDLPPQFAPSPGLTLTEISRYDDRGPAWYWNVLHLGEHTGTHFDAPIHWVTGKDLPDNATDTIPPRRFIGPACVIDVTADVERDPDFLLSIERVEAWEREHGRIPVGAWVLLRTGWSKRTSRADFLNVQADGAHSPGFHQTTSEFLAKERDVLGVGVETVGTDAGQAGTFTPPFPNHTIMHGNGKFGITSLVNLDQLPPTGAVVIAAPLKIAGGSGSPLRVIAIAPTA